MVFTTRLPRAAMRAFLDYMRSYNGQTKGARTPRHCRSADRPATGPLRFLPTPRTASG
ncbi:hypothetical protein AGR1A_pAt20174 [Agrobacterium fabacearum CFBP 5771]|nr:hypothetical protein AGR1A_pAt20174 [Agrobacterium fabacearum CFBP 5771]